jgi:hypothetical protein
MQKTFGSSLKGKVYSRLKEYSFDANPYPKLNYLSIFYMQDEQHIRHILPPSTTSHTLVAPLLSALPVSPINSPSAQAWK